MKTKVRELRYQRGITQQQLAALVHVSGICTTVRR